MATRRDVFNEIEFATVVGVAEAMRGEARVASSTQEAWAMRALVSLTSDCDGAVTDDGVGFNKSDTGAGRYLGHYVEIGGKLDDVEWSSAIDMLRKYHGQIGGCPRPDDLDLARDARVASLNGDGFRDRLKAVYKEAKRVQRESDQKLHALMERLLDPEIVIKRVDETWVVTTPYNEATVGAWRALHAEHGGRWDSARRARVVPYRAARALHALLVEHHSGQIALGPKGTYIIGGDAPPLEMNEALAEAFARELLGLPAPDDDEGEEDADEGEEDATPVLAPAPVAAPAPAAPMDPYEALALRLEGKRRA